MLESIKEYCNYFKNECKKSLNDLKSSKTFYKQIPNLLTIFRLIATIPINIFFFTGNIAASLVTCGIAAITDTFDGTIARKLKIQSQFGADLDAICDKLFILLMAIPITIQNPFMLLNIGLETAITYTNVKATMQKKLVKSKMIGKIKTWVLSLTVLLGYFLPLLNISPNLLTSFLITLPAVAFQSATLVTYLKINNQKINKIVKEIIETEKIKPVIKEVKSEEKKLVKELVKPANIDELRNLKESLLKKDDVKGHQKTKTDIK